MERRTFMTETLLGSLGVSLLGTYPVTANQNDQSAGKRISSLTSYPSSFFWGTATSAYQVEGAVATDGRGPSIWDSFSKRLNAIKDNQKADVSVDMYHKFKEDIALMQALNTNAYRFSISWPRVLPNGEGSPNQKGLDFYDRLIDALLEAGIEPFPTLYHWDLPDTLQKKYGGWASMKTVDAFSNYAALISKHFSDRIRHMFTINEMKTFVEYGYGTGNLAPGVKLPKKELNQLRHHVLLGHGNAVLAARGSAHRPLLIGPAENIDIAVPAQADDITIRASEQAMKHLNAGYMTAILEGAYPETWLEEQGSDAPRFTLSDMEIISTPIDFIGMNVYMPKAYILADENLLGYRLLPFSTLHPKMASSWHHLGPEALYWGPVHAKNIWNVKSIYITENGCGGADIPTSDQKIYDTERLMFLNNYLLQLENSIAAGAPVDGYFHWSLMDNFEWISGYDTRFGLYYVDYSTLKRIPKLSASFYASYIANQKNP